LDNYIQIDIIFPQLTNDKKHCQAVPANQNSPYPPYPILVIVIIFILGVNGPQQ